MPETGIVADFNLDMFMPLFPLKKLHVHGLAESTLAVDARAVGAQHGIDLQGTPSQTAIPSPVPINTASFRQEFLPLP